MAVNIMHRGARRIALRVFGMDDEWALRAVYRWGSEIPPDQRPFAIYKDGRTIYAWESDIAAAGEGRPPLSEHQGSAS